jgi:hypothetical protein
MCCSFVIPFFEFDLKEYFSNSPYPIPPMKAEIGDVLLSL